MEGVEILNISSTLVSSGMMYYITFVVVLFIIMGSILAVRHITTALLTYTLVCVLCFLATFNIAKESHTVLTIKVTGKVDMKLFYDTYEVLSCEGNLYQVKEREK